jgi:hypothetical protein
MNTATTPLRISIAGSPKFDTYVQILRKLGCRFDAVSKTWEVPAGAELKIEMHYMNVAGVKGSDSTLEAALAYFGMVDVSKPTNKKESIESPAHWTDAVVAAGYNGKPLSAKESVISGFPAEPRISTPSRCYVCGGKVDLRETWARPGYCGCEGE